jgi:DNA-binding NtrC family response regulator
MSLIVKYDNVTLGMSNTILLVEDDIDLIGIYKEILELHGYDIQTALNGQEGVEKFKQIKPSLVIMDGDMPVLDGYEAFKQIKEIDKDANVVIITGFSEFEPKSKEAIKQGLIKVISKPLGVDELITLTKKYTKIKLEE